VISRIATALTAAVVTSLLSFESGGYFPSEWGLQIGFFALAALLVVIAADAVAITRRAVAAVVALAGFAAWSLVSIAWSSGPDAPVQAAERDLIYIAALVALLLVLSPDRVEWLAGGIGIGALVVCGYALATRFFAGSVGDLAGAVEGRRLDAPIGYANALGVLAAFGIVIAVGFGFHRRLAPRVLGGAALVPLAATLYFTLSRASVIALAIGLVAFLGTEQTGHAIGGLVPVAVPSAAAVFLAVRSPLLDGGLSLARAQSSGHRLAWELALLALASGAAGAACSPLARTLAPVVWIGVAGAVAVGAAATLWIGPGELAQRVVDGIRSPSPASNTGTPTRRLLSGSAGFRSEYFRVAWRMVERQPVLGEGAGSYERWWLQDRHTATDVTNAHNLYLETLAELGPIGLALLLLGLAVPLAGPQARDSVAPAIFGAYVVFLAHVALDWDWQIPAVTLVGVSCAAGLLVVARPEDAERAPPTRVRMGLGALLVPLLVAGLVVHVGNRAADRSQSALDTGNDARAVTDARRARTWMPWAAQPWRLLGEAELAAHRDGAARTSLKRALARDPDNWITWYDLSTVTTGTARVSALARARRLNPLAPELGGSG